MSENPAERAQAYVKTIEEALKMTESVNDSDALRIIDYAKRYVADSRYFLESGKATTALASVAYAEGLLDCLKILGLANAKGQHPRNTWSRVSSTVGKQYLHDQVMRAPKGEGAEEGMRESDEKNIIRAMYLLQLRKPYFTEAELIEKTGLDQGQCEDLLGKFTASGILERKNGDRYGLLATGRSKIRVVLVGGVYDILHLGHLAALDEAKTYGDVLVVVIATDPTVETLKGRRPVFSEEDRRALVDSLKPVDAAILGYEDVGMGYEQVIDDVKPDIIALGYDQDHLARTVTELVNRKRLNIEIVRLSRFDKEKYLSSSEIRQVSLKNSKR